MLQIFKRQAVQYQFFATIYYSICEQCLSFHGKIFKSLDKELNPPLHKGCDCSILELDKSELKYHRELGQNMEERAKQELIRREIFNNGVEQLLTSPQDAHDLFQQAGYHDFFIEEFEEKIDPAALPLSEDPESAQKLLKLFINLNRFQYDKQRYDHIPPGMKADRIEYGERVIKSTFRTDESF